MEIVNGRERESGVSQEERRESGEIKEERKGE